MITDRHRAGGEDMLVDLVGLAARAGVHLVQVRERDLDGGPLVRLVRACVEAVRGTMTRVVVNDRIDVALAAGAHGVHLRSQSLPADRARAIVPGGFLIGRSVHAKDEAVRAAARGGLDYLIWGTLFSTPSKPDQRGAGLPALADVAAATPLPVLAVGGIDADNLSAVSRSGAAGFAAIGLFVRSPAAELPRIFETWAG